MWELFESYLLNSTVNPAQLEWKWAGLAVLFGRQLLNGSHDFFQTLSIFFKDYFIKNPQTTITLPFLTHNISAIGEVCWDKNYLLMNHFFVHIQSFVGLEFFSTRVAHKNLVTFVFFHGMSG